MGDHAHAARACRRGEGDPARASSTRGYDPITAARSSARAACSRSAKALRDAARSSCRAPTTGAAADDHGGEDPRAPPAWRRPTGRATSSPATRCVVDVDGGYSHEFTTAQVHYFLEQEYGAGLRDQEPEQVRGLRGPPDLRRRACRRCAPFVDKIETLRELQREFQRHTGVRDFSAQGRHLARHLPRGRARAVHRSRATSSRPPTATPAWAAATTRSPGASARPSTPTLVHSGFTPSRCRSRSASSSTGELRAGRHGQGRDAPHPRCTTRSRRTTLDRVMEFGGPGLATLSMDERATLANMATECSARSRRSCEADDETCDWIAARRPGVDVERAARARRGARPRRRVRRRRAHASTSSTIAADGGAPRRPRPRHPLRSDERRARSTRSARCTIDIAYGG